MDRNRLAGVVVCCVVAASRVFAQAGYVPSPYDAQHYDVSLFINPADSSIAGSCEISLFSIDDTLQNARFDVRDVHVDSVSVDGRAAAFVQDSASVGVHLYDVMPRNTHFVVKVSYHGRPGKPLNDSWGGMFWGKPDGTLPSYTIGVGFTSPDVSMTRRWMPCRDLPDDKAAVDFHLTVPRPLIAAANGKLVKIDSLGAFRTYHWHEAHETATYLMAVAVGAFDVLRWTADSIPVEVYSMPADTAASRTYFQFLDGALKTFQARYGPYPFDKVGYVLAALGGGMEHQTLITLGPNFVHANIYRSIAAHELSHQWWGDLVSPFEFKEAWLSEGFAQFSEAIFAEGLANHAAYVLNIRAAMKNYFSSARSEGTFSLYDFPRASPSSNYPNTIYQKGASVLSMLRWLYGDSLFFAALGTYRQQHQYGSATSRNLQHAFELVTGDTLGWYFDEWVYKAGWPVVRTSVHQSDSIRLTIVQTQDRGIAPLFRMPYDIAITFANGDTLRQRIMMEAVDSQVISMPATASAIVRFRLDPDSTVLGTHTDVIITGIDDPVRPRPFWLSQNFPNPVGGAARTTIRISIGEEWDRRQAHLMVYDVLGRLVRDCTPLLRASQDYVELDVNALPEGIYRYVLDTPVGRMQRVMTVAR